MIWLKRGAGGIFFLLPLFFLPPVQAFSAFNQLVGAKFALCFLLGNTLFALYLGMKIHPLFSLIHFVIALNTALLFSPTGSTYLYTLTYWGAGVGAALLFLELGDRTRSFLFLCVVYGAVASAALGIFQALDLDPILSYAPTISAENRVLPVGLFGQTTKHGAFLAIAFGMALGLRQSVAAVIILAVALMTKSSFTYLSLAGSSLVALRYLPHGKSLVRGAAVLGGLAFAVVYALFPLLMLPNGRFSVWNATLRAWWDGPRLFGFGPGSFEAIFPAHFQPKTLAYGDFIQAHNDYVQVAFEYGWLGVTVLAVGAVVLFECYYKNWWQHSRQFGKTEVKVAAECGLAAILLNALGNFPFQLAPHYFLAILFLAVLLGDKQAGYNKL